MTLGTIRYAAPEYLFGEEYNHRIDTYSLGTIVSELFFGERIYSNITNWAEIIVIKSSEKGKYLELKDCRALHERIGPKVTEFVKFIINYSRSAKEHRRLNILNISQSCEDKIYKKTFRFDRVKGIVKQESPNTSLMDKSGKSVPVEEAAEHINKELTKTEINYLLRILRKHYCNLRDAKFSRKGRNEQILGSLEMKNAVSPIIPSNLLELIPSHAGFFLGIQGSSSQSSEYMIHRSIIEAYRYELL